MTNNNAAYKPQVELSGSAPTSTLQKLNSLFQQIDTSGKGHITKVQFEQSFSKLSLPISVKEIGQDGVLKKLDPNGTGIITKPEFIQRMASLFNQRVDPAKDDSADVKFTPATGQTSTSGISPLDGFFVGHIIDIEA
jgi:Ca2+-binding EF-hand superfamily protein